MDPSLKPSEILGEVSGFQVKSDKNMGEDRALAVLVLVTADREAWMGETGKSGRESKQEVTQAEVQEPGPSL